MVPQGRVRRVARQQPENRLAKRIKVALEGTVGGLWLTIHGSSYQQAGIPDLIVLVEGMFFGLEVKMPDKRDNTTKLQDHFLTTIRQEGGIAAVVTSPKEALAIVRESLGET